MKKIKRHIDTSLEKAIWHIDNIRITEDNVPNWSETIAALRSMVKAIEELKEKPK